MHGYKGRRPDETVDQTHQPEPALDAYPLFAGPLRNSEGNGEQTRHKDNDA